ncbi:MAG: trimeric intracellular cation channel family protein [Paludibacteraceae bacterium]|nr:trimeric intracellular cation channel family protein [Paludibacteraceae bacterium]
MDLISIVDYAGTFAFAISGIRLASAKNFDWFGAYVVGFVTAIGGGTTRDLLLDVTPFWMLQPSYIIVTGIALLVVILMGKRMTYFNNAFFIFDAIGLGLFVVVGVEKSMSAGFPVWVTVLMGMITGSVGGIIRDILINELPLIFRKDIYALACIFGGVIFYFCTLLHLPNEITQAISAASVILIRILAVKYHWSIPVLKNGENNNSEPN